MSAGRLPLLAALAAALGGCLSGGLRTHPGPLRAGMTREEVAASWGAPESMSRARSELGESESWIYSDGRAADFEGGVLKSFEDPSSPRK